MCMFGVLWLLYGSMVFLSICIVLYVLGDNMLLYKVVFDICGLYVKG